MRRRAIVRSEQNYDMQPMQPRGRRAYLTTEGLSKGVYTPSGNQIIFYFPKLNSTDICIFVCI